MFWLFKSKTPDPAPVASPFPAPDAPVYDAPPVAVPETRWRKWRRRISRGFAIFCILFIMLVGWLALTAPLSKSLEPIVPPQITLLASDGTPIARSGAIVDAPVMAADLPRHVTGAFLAIEDRRFYSHWGVDPRSIARAVWSNVTGGRTQGGSTITQQLAKFTFLTPKRTLGRKAREALIAFWLEAWLSKDEILERYLSNAYFGDNTYGLRAASLHYFYRQPEKLTPAQAAMLAGLVQAPSRLAPTKNPGLAEERMQLVLNAMVATGYLSETERKAIRTPRIDVRSRNTLPTGTYFADWALPEARKLSDVGYSRQTIKTTLDARLQAVARRVTSRAGVGQAQVALVAMRPNGEVVAMVGGKDYAASPFNRATQARRQPGSTFKLFVYLAALRAGWEPDDVIDNQPIETGSYRPKNSGGAYSKTITLEDAFATSSNVAAVRLLREVGDDKVIDMARDLGVTAPMTKGDPSLALGTSSMTLLELTAAYAAVAANSYPVVPHAFEGEEKGWFENLISGPSRFRSRVHEDIERMLRAAVNRGTGRAARLPQANFGKTGTSQDNRDALFVGYANGLVVGVWIGNDDNSPLRGISGGGLPARIWRDFMMQASGQQAAPPRREADPRGPVEPQDIPDVAAIPVGDRTRVGIEGGDAVISTEINGSRIDLRLPITKGAPEEPAPAPP
ncbi:MAG: transglycosylase domain-containing protein [Sphingopyxis sp.]|nr:transglycosylase domain-containing protein [Sphingopyxis sp.]